MHRVERSSYIKRPRTPSHTWVQYESQCSGMDQTELKEKHKDIYNALRRSDELIFVPRAGEHIAVERPLMQIPSKRSSEIPSDYYTLSEMHGILKECGFRARVSRAFDGTYGSIQSLAQQFRSRVEWFPHVSQHIVMRGTKTSHYHSPKFTHALLLHFAQRYTLIQQDERARLIYEVTKYFNTI